MHGMRNELALRAVVKRDAGIVAGGLDAKNQE
jgi:hypothetical protein